MELITTEKLEHIALVPENELREVLQNVKTILLTPQETAPMCRSVGVKMDALDKPMQQARVFMTRDIFDAMREQEARADVRRVTYADSEDGTLVPRVHMEVVRSGG